MKTHYFIFIFVCVLSCKQQTTKKEYHSHKESVDILISSTNIDTLGQIINLKEFRPIKAAFRYYPIYIIGLENDLNPTYYLDAIMYFDESSIRKIKNKSEVLERNANIYYWKFKWLTSKDDLEYFDNLPNIDIPPIPSYKDSIFTKTATFIILDNKIYLSYRSK